MTENVSCVKSFLAGVVDKKFYRELVANLFFIYCATEEQMEIKKNSFGCKIYLFSITVP